MSPFRTLTNLYRALSASPRLVGVQQAFGGLQGLGETAAPRILWQPLEDRGTEETRVVALQVVIDGKPVQIACIGTVVRTCRLQVEVPATGDETCYDELEDLLRRIYLALKDELKSYANYQVGPSPWADRDEVSKGFIGADLMLSVNIPIHDAQPTAQLQAVNAQVRSRP